MPPSPQQRQAAQGQQHAQCGRLGDGKATSYADLWEVLANDDKIIR